jgi:hypothetical protein
MEDQLFEYALGSPSNRGTITNQHNFANILAGAVEHQTPLYRSIYNLEAQEATKHFSLYKSIKGYRGKYFIEEIPIDVDRGTQTDEEVLNKARDIVSTIQKRFQVEPEVWYSGRGYHLILPDIFGFEPSESLPATVKATIQKHLPYGDTSIYMNSSLFRVRYSINDKSGLWKVPIRHDTFWKATVEEIIALASEQPQRWNYEIPESTKQYSSLILRSLPEKTNRFHQTFPVTPIVTCMQKCYNKGAEEGTRHVRMLRMASAWRRSGTPYEGVVDLLKKYASEVPASDVEKVVRGVYINGYSYSCHDEIMQQFCSPECIYYQAKSYGIQIVSAEGMERDFVKFLHSDSFKNAINLADLYTIPDYNIYPGEFVVIWGDTKLGKSAFAQNLCIHWKDKKVLYMSLEVAQDLMYRRFLQIAHNMKKEDVYRYYLDSTNTLSKAVDHIRMITISPNLDDIARIVAETNAQIVVVDTLDSLVTVGGDNEKTSRIAVTLKNLAQKYSTIIVGIHHISKAAILDERGKTRRLTIHSGKNSSAIEQKADKIIGIEGRQDNPLRIITSLGARDESSFVLRCTMNKDTFRFTQIT